MRAAIKWAVVVVVILHGLLHLLGAAKGLGWAEVSALTLPVSPAMGAAWLAAGTLVVATGTLLAGGSRWSWVVGAVAVVVSQTMIVTSWGDAQAGTLANVVLLAAVVYGYASRGPTSHAAEFRRSVAAELSTVPAAAVIAETDLTSLPPAVAGYLRRCGVVGKPGVTSFRARFHGRIRATAGAAWMPFTGEQVNTYGAEPSRMFAMDATLAALPVDVLHSYRSCRATMRVKACSLVPMANAHGPDLDRAETVTVFNDLCLLAPAAMLGAQITWRTIDDDHVQGTFTNGPHTVRAELAFDRDHELIDFVSHDRSRASTDGVTFTPQRWSTPVRGHRTVDGRHIVTDGDGVWHAPDGDFTYLEFHLDEIAYNLTTGPTARSASAERVIASPGSVLDSSPTSSSIRP